MRYMRIMTSIWANDDKFPQFSDDEKLLCLYFFTSPHSNMIGLYRLPLSYMAEDLKWPVERLTQPFAKLLGEGMFEWDPASSLLLVKNLLRHFPLENPNQVKKGISVLNELPRTNLFSSLLQNIEPYAKPFHEPFNKRLRERLGEPLPQPVSVSVTVTVPVQSNVGADPAPETGAGSSADERPPETPKPKKSKIEISEEAKPLCNLLKELCLAKDEKFRVKSEERWIKDMDLLLRVDGRDRAEIEKVMRWAKADKRFWSAVILSPGNLRDNFQQIIAQMARGGSNGNSGTTNRNHANSRDPREFDDVEVGKITSGS